MRDFGYGPSFVVPHRTLYGNMSCKKVWFRSGSLLLRSVTNLDAEGYFLTVTDFGEGNSCVRNAVAQNLQSSDLRLNTLWLG